MITHVEGGKFVWVNVLKDSMTSAVMNEVDDWSCYTSFLHIDGFAVEPNYYHFTPKGVVARLNHHVTVVFDGSKPVAGGNPVKNVVGFLVFVG